MGSTPADGQQPQVIQWIVDTRRLWAVPQQSRSQDGVQLLKTVAARPLSFLSAPEQESVLRYYHIKDAKMSLASHLLKHLIITKFCSVPWAQSTISRDDHGKPCFLPSKSSQGDENVNIDFNVSHQAGIVSLIAAVGFNGRVEVGTDIVCVNERLSHEYAHIEKSGFFDWVDVYAEVFAESEISHMKLSPVTLGLGEDGEGVMGYGNDAISRCQWRYRKVDVRAEDKDGQPKIVKVDSNDIIDGKLRRFYAMWCLREAYIKMTGEALLAPWLKELEILNVEAPSAKTGVQSEMSLEAGDVERDFQIHFKEKEVKNVKMELSALGTHFLIAGAARGAMGVEQACPQFGNGTSLIWRRKFWNSQILIGELQLRRTIKLDSD